MKTLTERLNMKFGKVNDAHVIKNVTPKINSYETLCLICAELNINLDDVTDADFETCSDSLRDFFRNANDDTGYVVSVWFD